MAVNPDGLPSSSISSSSMSLSSLLWNVFICFLKPALPTNTPSHSRVTDSESNTRKNSLNGGYQTEEDENHEHNTLLSQALASAAGYMHDIFAEYEGWFKTNRKFHPCTATHDGCAACREEAEPTVDGMMASLLGFLHFIPLPLRAARSSLD